MLLESENRDEEHLLEFLKAELSYSRCARHSTQLRMNCLRDQETSAQMRKVLKELL